jgi:hypothetical protein
MEQVFFISGRLRQSKTAVAVKTKVSKAGQAGRVLAAEMPLVVVVDAGEVVRLQSQTSSHLYHEWTEKGIIPGRCHRPVDRAGCSGE